jgi:hypothetical protein
VSLIVCVSFYFNLFVKADSDSNDEVLNRAGTASHRRLAESIRSILAL